VTFDTDAPVDVDGVSADESVFVEILAGQGKLKGGGKGWVADALKTWNVKVVVVELDDADREKIRVAQLRQVMLNPSDGM
jgi:hypothetical protein